jgi:hypothetical protein
VDPVASSHSPSPVLLDCFGECLCRALKIPRRESKLAICGVPSIGVMCEDREGDCDSEEDEDGDEH